jgi:hypothetical protein
VIWAPLPNSSITPDRILAIGYGFRAAKVLMSAIELDVFTELSAGELKLDPVAQRIGLDDRGARDFLDALVALRLLDRDDEGNYANTPEADRYLDANSPTYLGGLLMHLSGSEYRRWASLTASLRTGQPQTDVGPRGNYPARYADPDQLNTFVRGMTGSCLSAAEALARKLPWQDYTSVIDIGTAQGCVPVAIARAHAHLYGGGFDLPPVRMAFDDYVRRHGLSDRLRFYSGDFLREPLPEAQVLVMGRVLHNWDLPTKHMLLQKAYAALPPDGALIVCESFIDDARRTSVTGLLNSLNMLVMTAGGFDYTPADCITWMREVGFRKLRTDVLTADQSAVIGIK